MLAQGHLDASRLQGNIGGSRRDRTTNSKARICFECGGSETAQWRRHPETKVLLCNSCGQKAYRTRML
ncbi:hypothetical protein R3P38DRAFT_3125694 [Favolaschia claudopus]|uniref:GATA-type domain-containing protein n=1 Tax=Favolaschia claudopus TaxID=2862362 RepID=A0AAV9ZAL6_9AGAR